MKKVLFTLLCLALIGCSTTQVQMQHKSYRGERADNPIIAIGQFSDYRKHDANWLGAIRGGYGNPLKTLETPKPVKDIVRDAFQDGLRQRGILASADDAKYVLSVDVQQYDCNQYVRKESHIKLDIKVVDIKNNQQVFSDRIAIDNVEGSILSMKTGVFGSVEELKNLAEKTLAQAVDGALDSPGFTRLYKTQ
ncbi:SHOCT domain-containing protein [Thiocapsa sp.]|uniref:SHOCT domain-containing protein n=1 Tax=Thiocapsa sp. TaxID=2024551 RepID=UPI0025E51B16|nr:SHOCT domain-containing protein [Thiocapsa sp.]